MFRAEIEKEPELPFIPLSPSRFFFACSRSRLRDHGLPVEGEIDGGEQVPGCLHHHGSKVVGQDLNGPQAALRLLNGQQRVGQGQVGRLFTPLPPTVFHGVVGGLLHPTRVVRPLAAVLFLTPATARRTQKSRERIFLGRLFWRCGNVRTTR